MRISALRGLIFDFHFFIFHFRYRLHAVRGGSSRLFSRYTPRWFLVSRRLFSSLWADFFFSAALRLDNVIIASGVFTRFIACAAALSSGIIESCAYSAFFFFASRCEVARLRCVRWLALRLPSTLRAYFLRLSDASRDRRAAIFKAQQWAGRRSRAAAVQAAIPPSPPLFAGCSSKPPLLLYFTLSATYRFLRRGREQLPKGHFRWRIARCQRTLL